MSLGDEHPQWTRLTAGVYDDNHGGMHLDLAEMLEAGGYPDTEVNRETLTAAARDLFRDLGTEFVVVDD